MSSPYDGQSIALSVPGISGENTASGTGVSGSSNGGYGIEARSVDGIGLYAIGQVRRVGPVPIELPGQAALFDGNVVVNGSHTVNGNAQVNGTVIGSSTSGVGVHGESQQIDGISGIAHDNQHSGVFGTNDSGGGSGITGTHTSAGNGVSGSSTSGNGLLGYSVSGVGVHGESQQNDGISALAHAGRSGVWGNNDSSGNGVSGSSTSGNGVYGESQQNDAISGLAHDDQHSGVFGTNDSDGGSGVTGTSLGGNGISGIAHSTKYSGILGTNDSGGGSGVTGTSPTGGYGISGTSDSGIGVSGWCASGVGVHGESQQNDGISGLAHDDQHSGVFGTNDSDGGSGVTGTHTSAGNGVSGSSTSGNGVYAVSTTGNGVYGKSSGYAGYFDGNVQINGNVTVGPSGSNHDIILADFSEEFDIMVNAEVEPGTVMVLNQQGMLEPSQQAYDKKAAGVISGAGNYRPGITLDKRESLEGRMPVALVGKVYCKVDAQYTPIEVGDLLTTSPTPGHAMKAADPFKAFGAVIGKALRPLEAGQGLIPILIALQ